MVNTNAKQTNIVEQKNWTLQYSHKFRDFVICNISTVFSVWEAYNLMRMRRLVLSDAKQTQLLGVFN